MKFYLNIKSLKKGSNGRNSDKYHYNLGANKIISNLKCGRDLLL